VNEISTINNYFFKNNCASWSYKPLEIGTTVKIFILEPSIKILLIAEPDSFSILVRKSIILKISYKNAINYFHLMTTICEKITTYITTKYELKARFIKIF
jgi:hypothetical protein